MLTWTSVRVHIIFLRDIKTGTSKQLSPQTFLTELMLSNIRKNRGKNAETENNVPESPPYSASYHGLNTEIHYYLG